MTTAQLIEGKTKIIREGIRPHEIKVEFKNKATAFNGEKIADVPGKGELNAQISVLLFRLLESAGISTCFVSQGSTPTELIYRHLKMIPLEVVVRNFAYGSIKKRFQFEEGFEFNSPLVEFFYKNDAVGDPQLTEDMIAELKILPEGVTPELLKRLALQVNQVFLTYFNPRGIRCADFKLEFGLDETGQIRLGDELSPDNFRLRDIQTGEILDKDVFRLDVGDLKATYEKLFQRLQQTPASQPVALKARYQAVVQVGSRKNILNPESKTILESLKTMGYQEVTDLRAGRCYTLTIESDSMIGAEQRVKAMAETLLCNPVIEDYEMTLTLVGE